MLYYNYRGYERKVINLVHWPLDYKKRRKLCVDSYEHLAVTKTKTGLDWRLTGAIDWSMSHS